MFVIKKTNSYFVCYIIFEMHVLDGSENKATDIANET